MLRNQKLDKKIRLGIIAAGWIVYLLIILIPRGGDRSNVPNEPTRDTEIVTTMPEKKPAETTKTTTKPAETKVPETEPVPEETEPEETTAPEPTASEIQQMIKDGDYSLVTPEFKQTMDAYEKFYDDYIAFMKKYNSGEGDMMSMLNDYMTMMSNLEEWSRKIDAIDESKLSVADDAYYLLVTLRIEQKLLSMM